ncbi:hypothetical protein BH24GEM1_BH24GEM1_13280 [soil metagenome]
MWLVALVYWLVGTVYGLVAWQLARRGFLLPPESLSRLVAGAILSVHVHTDIVTWIQPPR